MRRTSLLVLAFMLIGLLILAPIVPQLTTTLIYPAHSQFSDLTITHWPAFAYTRDQLTSTGQIPLWRTSILSGTPFAADPLAGLFYPLHWFAFIPSMPLGLAFNLLMWLHLALAAGTMYALMRAWEVSRAAALVAALAYAAAPKIVAHMGVGHVTLVEAWAWLPLVIAGLVKGRGTLAGVALAMCLLADARMAAYAVALAISYLLIVETQHMRSITTRLIRPGVVCLIAALALSAAAWLPALTLTGDTARSALTAQEAGALSLDPVYLLGTIIADRSGAAERTTYFGLVVFILAITGVKLSWRTQRRLMIWLIAIVGLGVIVALGTHTPLYSLLNLLPGFKLLRVPARAWFMVTFAMAVLAGFGVQGLIDWAGRVQRRSVLLAIVVSFATLTFGLLGSWLARSISILAIAIFVPLTVLVIMLRVQHRLKANQLMLLMVLLLSLDLLSVDWMLYRPVSIEQAFADGAAPAAWLSANSAGFRTYSPSYSLPQHVAQQYQLQLADGIDPLQLQRYLMFMWRASGVGPWGYSVTLPAFPNISADDDIRTALRDVEPNLALLGLLNVQYIAAAFPLHQPDLIERAHLDSTYLYENQHVLPRAFVVGKVDVAANAREAAQWLEQHDVSRAAVVEGLPAPIDLPVQPQAAEIVGWQADRIQVRASGPGWLVLSEVYAPDWIARVDDQPAEILPTDLTLRGVYVPQGDHTIEFAYQPRSVFAGVAISLLSVAACLIGLLIFRRAARRK